MKEFNIKKLKEDLWFNIALFFFILILSYILVFLPFFYNSHVQIDTIREIVALIPFELIE